MKEASRQEQLDALKAKIGEIADGMEGAVNDAGLANLEAEILVGLGRLEKAGIIPTDEELVALLPEAMPEPEVILTAGTALGFGKRNLWQPYLDNRIVMYARSSNEPEEAPELLALIKVAKEQNLSLDEERVDGYIVNAIAVAVDEADSEHEKTVLRERLRAYGWTRAVLQIKLRRHTSRLLSRVLKEIEEEK